MVKLVHAKLMDSCPLPSQCREAYELRYANCAARQCSPLRRKFMECYIIKPAQSLLVKHLVIGQR